MYAVDMVNVSMWINANVLEVGKVRNVMYHCALVWVKMMQMFVQDVVDALEVTTVFVINRTLDISVKENASIVMLTINFEHRNKERS